ncbi:hypothetical protein F2Q69_00049084 [Brassica cretica]|uniref:Uncharacterized protein n=1 Tax=Brassica cretica TaxID=69181 RepID=A0A8S9PWU0_BRACR|nr:hypothetical protein F2Q69_00049084 [Brassica cretica]
MPLENYSLLTEANISKATCNRGTKGPPYLYIIVLSFTGQPQEKKMTPIEEIKYLDMSIEIAESLRLKIEVQKCLPFAARGD